MLQELDIDHESHPSRYHCVTNWFENADKDLLKAQGLGHPGIPSFLAGGRDSDRQRFNDTIHLGHDVDTVMRYLPEVLGDGEWEDQVPVALYKFLQCRLSPGWIRV